MIQPYLKAFRVLTKNSKDLAIILKKQDYPFLLF